MALAIKETNLELPGQVGEVYRGKVGDVYTIEHDFGEMPTAELLAIVRTDRISAYDVVLPEPIPHKGQVLNEMSTRLLNTTADVAPNWLIGSPDPNVSVGYKANPFKVEMIMRGVLLGSAWKLYNEEGVRSICGNELPEGMSEFQSFPKALLTPTTKAEVSHDENISLKEIIDIGLATEKECREMKILATGLFMRGQLTAAEKGLILADTKYEFGRLATGQIVAIDEVHTPDSSRYLYKDEYTAYVNGETKQRPRQLSKEFVREWLKEQGFTGQEGQSPPIMSPQVVEQVSDRYRELFEEMMGVSFEPIVAQNKEDRLEDIETNIINFLKNLKVA